MQLTKLDHWLKQKFVYQTYIFTLRLPEQRLPRKARVEEIEVKKKGDFRYKLTIHDNKKAEKVMAMLKDEHIMHTTRIIDKKSRFNRFVMPPDGKSFTFQIIGRIVVFTFLLSLLYTGYVAYNNETIRLLFKQSIEDLKTGL